MKTSVRKGDTTVDHNNLQNTSLITIDDLCEILSIGKNRAYDMLRKEEIKSFKIGKVWKIPRMAVDEYIIERAKL